MILFVIYDTYRLPIYLQNTYLHTCEPVKHLQSLHIYALGSHTR